MHWFILVSLFSFTWASPLAEHIKARSIKSTTTSSKTSTTTAKTTATTSTSSLTTKTTAAATTSSATTKTTTTGQLFCSIVDALVTIAQEQAVATTFCSSYLSIPVITSTATSTSYYSTSTSTIITTTGTATVGAVPVTITVTASVTSPITTTFTATATSFTSTSTITTTVLQTSCAYPAGYQKVKRSQAARPSPSCFSTYTSGALLSSACSCLSIPASTTTTTSVTSVVKTTSTTLSTLATVTTTTTTHTTTTPTVQPTVSTTVTITTVAVGTVNGPTTTQLAVPTFSVLVVGGDKNGLFFYDDDDYSPARLVDYVDESDATTFSTDINGQLIIDSGSDAGGYAVQDEDEDADAPYIVYASNTGDLTTANSVSISCSLIQNTDGTCPLSCVGEDGGSVSYDCGAFWRLAPTVPGDGCYVFTPYAVGGM